MAAGKTIVGDVFGELLETGKQTVKTGAKAASDISKQTVKTLLGQTSQASPKRDSSSLDWLEKMAPAASPAPDDQQKKKEEEKQAEQVKQLSQLDKRKSSEAYQKIQEEIQQYRRAKAAQPRKYQTAAKEYDPEQHKDPETFWEKMKKRKEEMKKKLLPWTSKQTMGTGEITRGVSG